MQGDFGKPRPALVIQANQFSDNASLTILPITSTLVDAPYCALQFIQAPKTACRNLRKSWWTRP
nr:MULTISPECIES: type II toxin-antitoxin system PemK/MazF family toxin [unclassified Ectothiorhodospira]